MESIIRVIGRRRDIPEGTPRPSQSSSAVPGNRGRLGRAPRAPQQVHAPKLGSGKLAPPLIGRPEPRPSPWLPVLPPREALPARATRLRSHSSLLEVYSLLARGSSSPLRYRGNGPRQRHHRTRALPSAGGNPTIRSESDRPGRAGLTACGQKRAAEPPAAGRHCWRQWVHWAARREGDNRGWCGGGRVRSFHGAGRARRRRRLRLRVL